MENFKNNSQDNCGDFVALDDARGFILMQFNIEFNERQIRDFIDQTNLETIALGSRIHFLKKDFIAKFPAYVNKKNELEKQKRKNRESGGKDYNLRVDAFFGAIYNLGHYGLLDLDILLRYLKRAAPKHFKYWSVNDLSMFCQEKLARNGDKFAFEDQAAFCRELQNEFSKFKQQENPKTGVLDFLGQQQPEGSKPKTIDTPPVKIEPMDIFTRRANRNGRLNKSTKRKNAQDARDED